MLNYRCHHCILLVMFIFTAAAILLDSGMFRSLRSCSLEHAPSRLKIVCSFFYNVTLFQSAVCALCYSNYGSQSVRPSVRYIRAFCLIKSIQSKHNQTAPYLASDKRVYVSIYKTAEPFVGFFSHSSARSF